MVHQAHQLGNGVSEVRSHLDSVAGSLPGTQSMMGHLQAAVGALGAAVGNFDGH